MNLKSDLEPWPNFLRIMVQVEKAFFKNTEEQRLTALWRDLEKECTLLFETSRTEYLETWPNGLFRDIKTHAVTLQRSRKLRSSACCGLLLRCNDIFIDLLSFYTSYIRPSPKAPFRTRRESPFFTYKKNQKFEFKDTTIKLPTLTQRYREIACGFFLSRAVLFLRKSRKRRFSVCGFRILNHPFARLFFETKGTFFKIQVSHI